MARSGATAHRVLGRLGRVPTLTALGLGALGGAAFAALGLPLPWLLGAALLGIEGDEVVQGLLDMMYAKAPYTVIRRAMHIHPTVYEMIPYMFDDLQHLA